MDAKTRLQAFELNRITRNHFHPEDNAKRWRAKKVGTLAGFDIFEEALEFGSNFTLVTPNDEVAVYLELSTSGHLKNHIELVVTNPKFIGQKLAYKLHEYLLRRYRKLTSDDSLSVGATKLWMALIKAHSGCILIPRFHDHPTYRVAIHGWSKGPNGEAWPKVMANGEIVPVNTLKSSIAQKQALRCFVYEVVL